MKPFSLSALLFCIASLACGPEPDAATLAAKPAMTVTAATVRVQNLAQVVEAQGQIAPWQEAVLSARVAGLPLIELKAQVGDRVRRGEVLARFDDRTVRADLAQAKANLAQATANAVQAAATRDRNLKLTATHAVSEQAMQLAQTQAEVAEAQRLMAQAQVSTQEIRLQDTAILAVDDGVISARTAALGQVAQAESEMFRLICQERLEWRAELTAQQLSRVKSGQAVDVTLPDGQHVKGTVRQLAPTLDNATRLALAYVDLEGKGAAKAGMYASGQIQIAQGASLVVPAEAVVLRDGRSAVFLLDKEERVRQVPVDAGQRAGQVIEIIQGVKAGDVVAVRGAGFLADGDRVKRVDSRTPAISNQGAAE